MRVMCLNAWGGTLHDRLLPYLAASAPEVLCLQEVIHSPGTDRDWLTYRDGDHILPQRANLFTELRRALPDHQAMFCPAARGLLWDGDVPLPSLWGIATFVHAALPVIGQVQGFVHKDYGSDGYGDHPRSRNAHGVRVFDHVRKRAIAVTQMHGLRDPAGKHDTPDRRAQAQRLLDLSRSLARPGDLTILCGDFNVEPGSETLTLLQGAGLTDLVTAGGFPGTRSTQYRKPGRHADYMLISDPAAVRGFEVIYHPEVSDHCPLVLQV